MSQPRILNLDELPTVGSALSIVHEGVTHPMEILSVEAFIDQEIRQREHAKLVEKIAQGGDAGEDEVSERRAVEIIKEAVESFFPTLPVAKLPVHKLFLIFGWLNDVSAKVNEDGAPEGASGNAAGEASS